MTEFVLIVVGLLLALHLYRQYWTRRELPQVSRASFSGEMFRVGQTVIARRPAANGSTRTVVCHPGFLEDMRYFQALYDNDDCELVLVNNGNYHSPFDARSATQLDWPHNPFESGTIEHDGFYMGHILENLVSGPDVTVHGHSRGGAVALEAGRQYPHLTAGARAILEAPVLPQGRAVGSGSDPVPNALMRYLLPLALGLSRNISAEKLNRQPMMRPTNELKTELCLGVYTSARNYSTCVTNVRSIRDWQRDTDYSVYDHYPHITVVVGERDDVLDNASMIASAEAGARRNHGLKILRTEQTNHFVTLERPEYLRQIHDNPEVST